ncbi:MAG: HAD family phosphatase [Clostridia bacterium]|nr:HAD family phosphatase [Clostridia bacterium]
MYKLIAVDIDGTLINSQKKITSKTREAILFALEKGIHLVLSTGRPVQGIYDIYDQLHLDSPAITYNGAVVLNHKNGPVIYECPLLPADTKAIINKGDELLTTVAIWYQSKLYVNKLNDKAYEYSTISNVPPLLYDNKEEIFKNGATKVLYYDDVSAINDYCIQLKGTFSENVVFHTSRPYFLEFVNGAVSKARAMEKLGDFLHIKAEEMIAIGDGFNDLSMIEYAGMGVAMGNAPDEVKKKASLVTTSCDHDGVANAIYKLIR